jgi:uncharacterized membrane protein
MSVQMAAEAAQLNATAFYLREREWLKQGCIYYSQRLALITFSH